MALTPMITYPTNYPGFSTNSSNITISGTADSSTRAIYINDVILTGYIAGQTSWTYTTLLQDGENVYTVRAQDYLDQYSPYQSVNITRTNDAGLDIVITPPTGITLERGKNYVKISVIKNPEDQVIGYNFYASEEVGGGTVGYTWLNKDYGTVTEPDFFKEEKETLNQSVLLAGDIQTTTTTEKIIKRYYFSYIHNRVNQPIVENSSIPLSEPNHYIVTAVYFDDTTRTLIESNPSSEISAVPLLIDGNIKDLVIRQTSDIQKSFIKDYQTIDSDIDVKPGTITRDLHINVPSDEFERLYTILDFLSRSQSFVTLLNFDDANNDSISDPVLTSPLKLKLKEALLLTDDQAQDCQTLIDDSFTKLAGNVNVVRETAQQSIGQALFYTKQKPKTDVTISTGGIVQTQLDENNSAVQYTITSGFTLYLTDLENYYNSSLDRYELTLDIQALVAGSSGNVEASKITSIVSGVDPIFGVTNPNPTEFGQDQESNAALAERAILAFDSVDVGTEAGYLSTCLNIPNVEKIKIISAGESLMQRDIDPLRSKVVLDNIISLMSYLGTGTGVTLSDAVHLRGMVDIYVKGSIQKQYQETFGFVYKTVKSQAALIQSVPFFQFKANNSSININNPIYDVIEVKNVTKSASYTVKTINIDGSVTKNFNIIGDGDVIDLDETLSNNQIIGLNPGDIIQISYRFRASNPYIFNNQPVDSIISVVGDNSGSLTLNDNYVLQKLQDPLLYGGSPSSLDQMTITYKNSVPIGDMESLLNEPHFIYGETPIELNYKGVDVDTIIVKDLLGSDYTLDQDYEVIEGDSKINTKILRKPYGSIPSGQQILVDYEAGENFTVTYSVNTLLSTVQDKINSMKHLTADVLVKSAIKTPIDIEMHTILYEGSDQVSVDRKIRSAIGKNIASKKLNENIYQSDIVASVESISGVAYLDVPLLKMVRANGSLVLREALSSTWDLFITSGNIKCYKSRAALNWKTVEFGGKGTQFSGVMSNELPLAMKASANETVLQANNAYIDSNGYVYISLQDTLNPSQNNYTVTYSVYDAVGSRDIILSDIEYGAVGNLVITYDYIKKFSGF